MRNWLFNRRFLVVFALRIACALVAAISLASSYVYRQHLSSYSAENYSFSKSISGYARIKWKPDRSLNSLQEYIRRSTILRQESSSDSEFVRRLVQLVSENYKHHELLSHWSQNWIAYLLSLSRLPKLEHFASEIDPEIISRSKHSFCSQTSILLAALFEYHKINYHSIRFTAPEGGHFALVAYVDGMSYLIDANMVPSLLWDGSIIPRLLSSNRSNALGTFNYIYPSVRASSLSVSADNWNRRPALTAFYVRSLLSFVSTWIWIPCLILIIYIRSH